MSVAADRADRCLRVELVRVVEHGGLGGARGRAVVMAGDRVEQLGEHLGVELARALFDHPQPEVDVSQQPPLLRLPERGPIPELARPADVVQERRGEEEIEAQPRVQLGGLATERRHADGVLEEAAGVAVVPVRPGGGQCAERPPESGVASERVDEGGEPRVGDLRGEELEEPVELIGISAETRGEGGRIGILGGLDGAHLHLELPPEALDAPQHPDRVALREAGIEQVDVAPDSRVDPPARVCELEGEVRRPTASPPPLLLDDGEHAVDRPILRQLGHSRHVPSLWRWAVGTLVAMADVQPFRAVRYTGAAGSLADLVAPPYDAVDAAERARLYTRSPYNVVHVTLPESADEGARLYREWLSEGVLRREEEPAVWLAAEAFVGPDGIARERHGLLVSLAAEPYERGGVLPHERTHPAIREDRLGLLRASRVQPEPILLLADGSLELSVPPTPPEIAVDGTRVWRLPPEAAASLRDRQFLIADGHHRYESAVDLGAEPGSAGTRIMALVVPSHDEGLHVFPTHRTFARRPDLLARPEGETLAGLDEALERLAAASYARSAAIAYRRGRIELVRGELGELDSELVDRHGLEGIGYTPRVEEAVGAVDRGAADAAFLLREPRVDDVFARARRGERMPQKSTYFYPKPLSGLLFHPLDR